MKYVYPAIFTKDEDKIGVSIPDLPGCYTFGDNMADAIDMASDAIAMVLVSLEDEKKSIPTPSEPSSLKSDGIISLVVADTTAWRKQFDNKAVKKTLSIPSWLNQKAEAAGINFSKVLQESLQQQLKVN